MQSSTQDYHSTAVHRNKLYNVLSTSRRTIEKTARYERELWIDIIAHNSQRFVHEYSSRQEEKSLGRNVWVHSRQKDSNNCMYFCFRSNLSVNFEPQIWIMQDRFWCFFSNLQEWRARQQEDACGYDHGRRRNTSTCDILQLTNIRHQ